MRTSLGALLVVLAFTASTNAVKSSDFKKCNDSGFCRRGRALADRASESKKWTSPYSLERADISFTSTSGFTAALKSSLYPDIKFQLDVRILENGVIRVTVDEKDGLKKRYDEAASWALIREPQEAKPGVVNWKTHRSSIAGVFGSKEIVIDFNPFRIALKNDGHEDVVLNGEGLFHVEHFRSKNPPTVVDAAEPPVPAPEGGDQAVISSDDEEPIRPTAWFEGQDEDDYWDERFKSWTDSKPKGPESFSVDITFPDHGHVYGIPQRAAPLSLPATKGPGAFFDDPYRLWNLDVFEYEASSTMSLYGSIPFMHAHSERSTVGIFNAVASETWIDVSHPESSPKSTLTHWISESGIVDIFILPGPTPEAVFAQYAGLTGTTVMPAHWALGYHQCRWNYVSSQDVREVQQKFDESDMPMDVLWLDIEYSEDKKYMIWNDKTFPDPVEMFNDVAALERKMVVIVDPHLKRTDDYAVYKEAKDSGYLVKNADGSDFEGWCWPGSSSWVDFFNPATWEWWAGLFSLKDKAGVKWRWEKSTSSVFVWNDMNEPAVFNAPEITMPKDVIHHGGWEHRDVHNLNGMLYHNQTARALVAREVIPKRPFVLSRSFFSGSQRHGAIWTGDNMGTWEHMAIGVPMVLANGIAGMTFAGADVGGFFGNPGTEMLVRWYQVGAFAPFFRAHAHIDTKRREPYLLDEPYRSIVRDILKLRYTMLPIWYTAFREASVTGMPILRPQWVMFPKDHKGFAMDTQYYIGSSGLLVKPVTASGVTETTVWLAEDQVYYDYKSYAVYHGHSKGKDITIAAPLESFPLLVRGGSILSTRNRPRRSSPLMRYDPFTLTVALDKTSAARGELYLDDGETYSNEKGELIWREYKAFQLGKKASGPIQITSNDLASFKSDAVVDGVSLANGYSPSNPFAVRMKDVGVEKIVVLGVQKKPLRVYVSGSPGVIEWTWSEKTKDTASILTIKKPGVNVVQDWTVNIDYSKDGPVL